MDLKWNFYSTVNPINTGVIKEEVEPFESADLQPRWSQMKQKMNATCPVAL